MDLGYFNARVRSRRGALFKEADYAPFLGLGDVAQYADRLRSTPYAPYIDAAAARFKRAEDIVSAALTDSLSDVIGKLWELAPIEARGLLRALLSTWEVYNLKAIIRGLARGVKREEVQRAFVPAGELDRAALNALLSARDVPDLLRFLDTWGSPYAAPVREGMEDFLRRGNINTIEINLDRFAYSAPLGDIGGRSLSAGIIRDVLILRIDIRNIRTLLNIVGQGYSAEGLDELFIKGGIRLGRDVFDVLAGAKGREELMPRLAEAVKDEGMAKVLEATEPGDVATLEERLDVMAAKRLKRLSVVEPLSIATGASYIYMKVREVKNLRIMERAAAFGIPDAEVKKMLVYPV